MASESRQMGEGGLRRQQFSANIVRGGVGQEHHQRNRVESTQMVEGGGKAKALGNN
jgi:hypothetical protein